MSANFAFAQTDCLVPISPNGAIDPAAMASALSACADAPVVWAELVDRGTYDLLYSGPADAPDRQITGLAHAGWSQDIPLEIGTLFGFRAITLTDRDVTDAMIQIITYLPDGPDGPRPPDITQKQLTPGSVEAALFLIGSDPFLIPGEWRIEIRHDDQILAAQRFQLTAPAPDN